MRFVWIFIVLSSWQMIASNALECYNCSSSDGTNCLTGSCTSPSACISEVCADYNTVAKWCGHAMFGDGRCYDRHGCTECGCETDYCNNQIAKEVKDIKCVEYNESGVGNSTCEAYTCQVEACTPRYSPEVEMRTKIKGNCFKIAKIRLSRLTNGCKNVSDTTEAGVTLDCTRCNCDSDNCNKELPEDVKKYHQSLLDPPKPTTTTTPTPIPTTTPLPPTTTTVLPDHSEIRKPSGLLICILPAIMVVWRSIRG